MNENKDEMLKLQIIPRMNRFFSTNNNILLQLALGLLKNLCFDKAIREAVDEQGFIPKLVELLKKPNFRFMSIVLLYLLSMDDKIRTTLSFTKCINLVVKLIIHFPEPTVGLELSSLAVNLSSSTKNAILITEGWFLIYFLCIDN